jgi:NTE family protein
VPGLFAPVSIGGREYVDGGVWSPTNLDLARAGRGDHVLCLVPTAAMGTGPALAMRGLAAGWRLATSVETAAARRRGASVEIVAPDGGAASAMGSDLMNPARRARVLAEGYRQGSARQG